LAHGSGTENLHRQSAALLCSVDDTVASASNVRRRNPMGTTGENLATAFEQANETLISTLSNMSDEQWRRKCDGEGWPVAVTAHHIASSREQVMQMIRLLATSPGESSSPRRC
jgi:hypothetical protein